MVRVGADEGKKFIDAACKAHAMIDDAQVSQKDGKVSIKTTFSLLAATDAAQKGKSFTEYFPTDGGGVGKTWDLAEAARLVPQGADRKAGLEFDETKLKGQQVGLDIHMERPQIKNPVTGVYVDDETKPLYPRLGFGCVFSIFSAKAKDVPKDQQFLAMMGKEPPPPPAGAAVPAGNPLDNF